MNKHKEGKKNNMISDNYAKRYYNLTDEEKKEFKQAEDFMTELVDRSNISIEFAANIASTHLGISHRITDLAKRKYEVNKADKKMEQIRDIEKFIKHKAKEGCNNLGDLYGTIMHDFNVSYDTVRIAFELYEKSENTQLKIVMNFIKAQLTKENDKDINEIKEMAKECLGITDNIIDEAAELYIRTEELVV